ncbi:DUF6603 domain-containing protein [Streptomyces goshikiensis]|uniref:DUF6603 domain-containing protein n=1 Tax=Streptomyces goshikiensis TaxID=1942 RepID=UPI003693B528
MADLSLDTIGGRLDDAVSGGGSFIVGAQEVGVSFAALWDFVGGGEDVVLSTPRRLPGAAGEVAAVGSVGLAGGEQRADVTVTFTGDTAVHTVRLDLPLPDWRYHDSDTSWDLSGLRGHLGAGAAARARVTAAVDGPAASRVFVHLPGPGAEVPFEAAVDPDGTCRLSSALDEEGIALSALADLDFLPGPGSLVPELPEGLPAAGAGDPRLHGASFAVDSSGALRSVAARVRLLREWSVLGGDLPLALKNVMVDCALVLPGDGLDASAAMGLSATVVLGGAELVATVSVPDLTLELFASLPVGSGASDVLPASVAQQLDGLGLPPQQGGTGLTVSARGSLRTKEWSLTCALAGEIAMGPLTLTDLYVTASHGPATRLALSVHAAAVVEGVSFGVSLERSDRWTATGALGGLSLSDLARWAADAFGIDVPVIPEVTVDALVVTYDFTSRDFTFVCDSGLVSGDIHARLHFAADRQGTGGSSVLRATLAVDDLAAEPGTMPLLFDAQWVSKPGSTGISARWQTSAETGGTGVPITGLLDSLGFDGAADLLGELPEELRPVVTGASLAWERTSTGPGSLVVTAATDRLGMVVAQVPAASGPGSVRLVGVRGRIDARASDLPLIGEAIPPGRDVVLDGFHFAHASAQWTAAQVRALNGLVGAADDTTARRLPRFPNEDLARGLLAWVTVTADNKELPPLVVRPGAPRPAVVLGRERRAEEAASQEMNVVLGPVRLSGLGLAHRDGSLFLSLDAVLTVGPVQLVLLGLGIGVSPSFEITPALRGAGVVMDKPPLHISGMVERRTGAEVSPGLKEQFVGLAAIETGFFALHAAGSYAKAVDGWSSMFLFGEVSGGERGLFGPPPFRVIGISLGFGVNSTVRTPSIDQVGRFPLVNRLDGGGGGDTPEQVLEQLAGPGGWITPREGQYWGAGGIEFSSFEFLRTRALLLVEGGQSWKVMLIGRTTIDLPRSKALKDPIARLVIDLAIGYHHDQALFSMDAVVAPGSYVIDPAAELTGGLSLYIWGEDRTAQGGGKGFVFTLGGYHHRFKRPAYYPNPPRVGWRWARGPVTIRGQVYAALTDGAFMAGGELSANYDSGHGIQLQAWFTAWLDALVQWKPFYFDLSMGLSIGVAATVKVLFVRVRVSLEVGVSLDLWGPPIGGRARVKVWFITFTIDFGTGRDGVPSIAWPEFSVQLPAPLSIAPLRGLLVDVDPEEAAGRSAAGEPLLVSADGFAVRTEAAVPAGHLVLNAESFAGSGTDTIDIRPMGLRGVVSEHLVTLRRFEDEYTPTGWTVTPFRQGMPKAMWGAPPADPRDVLDGDGVLDGCLAGITFEIPAPKLAPAVGWVDAEALEADGLPDAPIPLLGSEPEGPPSVVDEDGDTAIAAIVDPDTGIASPGTADRRASVHAALAALGLAPGTDDPLADYAQLAHTVFTNPPMTTTAER